jgi:ABC-type transport system involved in multi-copper enzyme maturation permease subunit
MAILDQGYQHWQGQVAGHGWRWLAIARHGVRVNMKSVWVRILIILSWIPALVLAGFVCFWGLVEQRTGWAIGLFKGLPGVYADPTAFRQTAWTFSFSFFLNVEMIFAMVVVMSVGPGLISRDLRFNALQLYFSRPIRRFDYFIGKLGTIAWFLLLVTVAPSILAWVLGVLFSLSFTAAIATFPILLGVVVYGLILSVSAGLLMLAISSLTRRSGYVVLMWFGIWMGGWVLMTVLEAVQFVSYGLKEAPRMQRMIQRTNEKYADQNEEVNDRNNQNLAPAEREDRVKRRAERKEQRRIARERDNAEGEQREAELRESLRRDWRPLVHYTANLNRIGDALIGTYDAYDKFFAQLSNTDMASDDTIIPPEEDEFPHGGGRPGSRRGREPMQARWPWQWSAGVLLAIAAASVWLLHTRVRSLDRLK